MVNYHIRSKMIKTIKNCQKVNTITKQKNKYFTEQGPASKPIKPMMFSNETLSQKRYWLTPHYYFRFMKDIKMPKLPLHQ